MGIGTSSRGPLRTDNKNYMMIKPGQNQTAEPEIIEAVNFAHEARQPFHGWYRYVLVHQPERQ